MADTIDGNLNFEPEIPIQIEKSTDILNEDVDTSSKLRKAYHVAKRAVQVGVIAAEVGPGNEAIRFGAFAASQFVTHNPLVGGAVLGGSTFVVEGAAALATADLITTEKSTKAISWVNSKLHKIVPEDAKMTPVTEAGVAMVGGSVVVLAEKQREDPTRTAQENRRHGIFTAGWMGGVFALEGALISEGIANYSDIKKVGPAVLGFAGVTWAFNKAKSKLTNNKNSTT
ncbi:MAG TPA: hypothetical protein VLF39_02455 [Candidatus Saccharimonadales bacterium]|nr:hypothetical protein [Candidatus Saccharimonadales bacterium]